MKILKPINNIGVNCIKMVDKKKIFVVDDSETNLFLIKALFENESDIVVDIEKDSRRALSHIKKNKPDLIILDIMMPYIDGFSILKQINSDTEIKNIPILIVSAKDNLKSIEKESEYIVAAYIKKPIVMKEFTSNVNSILYKQE